MLTFVVIGHLDNFDTKLKNTLADKEYYFLMENT